MLRVYIHVPLQVYIPEAPKTNINKVTMCLKCPDYEDWLVKCGAVHFDS
jgi:hypothetical protein